MLYLICLLSLLNIKDGTSSFMLAGQTESVCVGSIMFNENSLLVFNTSVLVMDHQVSQVRLEGCGCFRLYQRSGKRGRSVRVEQRGVTQVRIKRVGSLVKEECSQLQEIDLYNENC